MKEYEFLNSERLKIWDRVTKLEEDVKKKTSDYERDAKQASKMASEYKNKSQKTLEQIDANSQVVNSKAEDAKQALTQIKSIKTQIENTFQKIEDYDKDLDARIETISENLTILEENFGNNASFVESLNTLQEHFDQGDEIFGKIDTLQKSVQSKKRDIDNLHRDIFGYTEKVINPDGTEVETIIEGLKDQLESSYEDLEKDFEILEKRVSETKTKTLDDYNKFLVDKNADYKKKSDDWNAEYTTVLGRINKLLPNALTTGLSYAYSEKKASEIEDSKKFATTFRYAALGLAAVSLIPFTLSIIFILRDTDLLAVINYMPRFVLAIIPLYIPVLWIAYSANKKLNLSKRLIEEYTHKEVLSKTFEGLAHQIDSLDDEEVSTELRIKLLYNILSVSSENPGKLISDYNKSDHPLMDALEKSASLSDAVDKLEAIPGMSKLAKILERKSKKIAKEQAEKVDSTLGEIVEETLQEETEL